MSNEAFAVAPVPVPPVKFTVGMLVYPRPPEVILIDLISVSITKAFAVAAAPAAPSATPPSNTTVGALGKVIDIFLATFIYV